MTVALFGSDAAVLDRVAASLGGEGIEARPFPLDEAARLRELGPSFHKAALIFREHGAGESTANIRKLLGDKRELILCTKLPDAGSREQLLDWGATDVVAPRSQAAEHVAERLLAQLILDGEVRPDSCGHMLGATAVMRRVYKEIETYASVSDPVLVLGETGTGKELVAREIHRLGLGVRGREDQFLALNCGVLRDELAASELFGHKAGSFTGAKADRRGLIAEAGRGTFFLDEIGELDLQVQAALLRVLEDSEVRRVGANQYEKVHARVVLATNRELEKECEQGGFRRDLFRRIRGFRIELPPLRERRADIPLLARHFLSVWNRETGVSLQIPGAAFDCLFDDDWAEGNLRDLRFAVRKAAAHAASTGSGYVYPLTEISELGRKLGQPAAPAARAAKSFTITCEPSKERWKEFVERAQSLYFSSLLEVTGGNRAEAIVLSGLQRTQFYEKIKELDPSTE